MAEAMKDSGQEWIGAIPESWDTNRIRYCLDEINVKNSPVKTEQILSLVKDKGVMLYEEKGDVGNKAKEDITGYKVAFPNTLIVNSMNILIGSVGISQYKGCVSPVYYVFREKDNSDLRFINYIFNTREFQKELRKYANGILEIRLRVSATDIFNRKMPLPSKEEQIKIADFLDEKCAEIDRLSEDIKKQIDILEEYKKSVITRAVTKGLDPNAAMKESGIDYLGKYPTNWKLSRVKFNLSEPMKYGATESGVEYSDKLPRYIRITDITSDNKLKEDGKLSLTWQQAKGYILSHDTILFARSGGTVGKTFYYKPSYGKAAFAGYLISAIPNEKKMLTEWLYFYTLSNTYWEWANQIFTQATIQNIGADKYSNLPITVPDIETQKTIILYLTDKCSEIDESIALKRNQLDKLVTYKKSIIYEYVTGKKRVA